MISFDALELGSLHDDPRTRIIAEILTKTIYHEEAIADAITGAGLVPGDYLPNVAKLAWVQAVPDVIREHRLDALVGAVGAHDPAFGATLEARLKPLLGMPGVGGWYPCHDPFYCGFVGPGAGRALIDRAGLRGGLHDLAVDDYRVLVVYGPSGSGKTHSWRLIDHLRQAGKLTGHKCVRVSTHKWGNAEVTGEMVAQSLADRLGLEIRPAGSGELEDARARKLLDLITGKYPADGVTRWIVIDGLDRPRVRDSARDVGRDLITMVADGELENTRLVITGFDAGWIGDSGSVRFETIPAIDAALVRAFLTDTATRLGRPVGAAELHAHVTEVLGGDPAPTLAEIEDAIVRLVKREWGPGPGGQNGG
jgi:hypothetical protein